MKAVGFLTTDGIFIVKIILMSEMNYMQITITLPILFRNRTQHGHVDNLFLFIDDKMDIPFCIIVNNKLHKRNAHSPC